MASTNKRRAMKAAAATRDAKRWAVACRRLTTEQPRHLEPVGVYDPYRPRVFGTSDELRASKGARDVIDMVMTNEAFTASKTREIAARTRAVAEIDAAEIAASLAAEARARRHKVSRP